MSTTADFYIRVSPELEKTALVALHAYLATPPAQDATS
jgi:hypothetical protein